MVDTIKDSVRMTDGPHLKHILFGLCCITLGFHKMRGISWLAAKTGQLLQKDSAPWSK
jgi:hypothetical protein